MFNHVFSELTIYKKNNIFSHEDHEVFPPNLKIGTINRRGYSHFDHQNSFTITPPPKNYHPKNRWPVDIFPLFQGTFLGSMLVFSAVILWLGGGGRLHQVVFHGISSQQKAASKSIVTSRGPDPRVVTSVF